MTYTIIIDKKNKRGQTNEIEYVYVKSLNDIKIFIKNNEKNYNNLTRISIYDYYRDKTPNFGQTDGPKRSFVLNSKREWRKII